MSILNRVRSIAQFHLPRHVASRHVRRIEHTHFECRACQTARLDMLDTTSLTSSTRRTCRVVLRRDKPSGIWAYTELHVLIDVSPEDNNFSILTLQRKNPTCRQYVQQMYILFC